MSEALAVALKYAPKALADFNAGGFELCHQVRGLRAHRVAERHDAADVVLVADHDDRSSGCRHRFDPLVQLGRLLTALLEQSMRAEWLKESRPSQRSASLVKLNQLKDLVGDGQIVSIAASGDQLIAVVADRRRTRLHRLGDPAEVRRNAERAASALRGLSSPGIAPAVAAARHRAFAAAIDAVDAALLAPLRLDAPHVVLVVPADLHALPWAALPSLRDRTFTLAPSVTWWIEAASSTATSVGSVLAVAGPRLAEAEAEARRLLATS